MGKFYVYLQHDSMECGVACLAMVLRHYGKHFSIRMLKDYCRATSEGVSLYGLSYAAGRLGMDAECGKVGLYRLCEMYLPCILYWDQHHFVVLYRIKNGRFFYVADPSRGRVRLDRDEFLRHWHSTEVNGKSVGIAMFLSPVDNFHSRSAEVLGEPAKSPMKGISRLLSDYASKYRKYLIQVVLGLFAGVLVQLVLPLFTQAIVDVGIHNLDLDFVWLVLAGQLVLTLSRTALGFIRRWLLLHMSMRVNISLLSGFFMKLLRLPMSFFDTKLTGDLLQRMTDYGRIQEFITSHALEALFSSFSIIVFSSLLFIYDVMIFFIFVLFCVLYSIWVCVFFRRRKSLDYETFDIQSRNKGKTYELMTSIQEIKLQGCESRRRWEWEDLQTEQYGVQLRSLGLQQVQDAGSLLINEIRNIVITVMSASAVMGGEMTFGMMLAVQYVIGQLTGPVEDLMSFAYSLQDVRISLERIDDISLIPSETDDGRNVASYDDPAVGIRLCGVCFKYDFHSRNPILDDISIHIPQGKVTALVGTSGSGKSTLMKLLLGYYPPDNGTINIFGTDSMNIDLKWWRGQCGVVMQESVIFSDTIARNIAVGDGEIDYNRLYTSASMACIEGFVQSLPMKYNTRIGRDGIGLSRGQCQRILIARAVYKNPDILFLDEATNSLDSNNERMIMENLLRFFHGRTVVVVAHRLSTVMNSDQIIVLECGRVVESGHPRELTLRKGKYYNLVRNQLDLRD